MICSNCATSTDRIVGLCRNDKLLEAVVEAEKHKEACENRKRDQAHAITKDTHCDCQCKVEKLLEAASAHSGQDGVPVQA